MRQRIMVLGVLLALIGLLPLSSLSFAQEPSKPTTTALIPSTDTPGRPSAAQELAPTRFAHHTKIVVELQDQPAIQYFVAAKASGQGDAVAQTQRHLAQVEQDQQQLLTAVAPLQAQVLYRTQRVYNGVALLVDADHVAAIAALPGVKAVHPLRAKVIETSSSVPFIGAPVLWQHPGLNLTGEGVKIGVIDSGIDYLHTNFGGTGLQADYSRNDTTIITDQVGYPSLKVAGGYDFVGDDYDADPDSATYQPIPHPDPDPMDCNPDPESDDPSGGHGSHVAGIAAGYGVGADGERYTGPYASDIAWESMRIGPGVAPQAALYALRVFGCTGSTDIVDPAIEWAVDPNGDGDFSDHLDILNLSLGSPFGAGASDVDTTATAIDNAVLAGVLVVTSAGSQGDSYYATGTPGTAARALSVAASFDNGIVLMGVRVNSPSTIVDVYEAATAVFGPTFTDTLITADVAYTQPADGCEPLTNAAEVNAKIALIDRGTCNFTVKVEHAQDAGALAVIVVNNVAGPPITMGGTNPNITIPSLMVSQVTGDRIKANLPIPGVNVTLSDEVLVPRPEYSDTIPTFTARGPRRDGMLKPDITAPGQTIVSTNAFSGNQGNTRSGTSMSAPHLAGGMALLHQLHPDWSIEALKALVMNTAFHDLRIESAFNASHIGLSRVGAGRVDLARAGAAEVIAYNADEPALVSVSFGNLEVLDHVTMTKEIQVENKGNQAVMYAVGYTPMTIIPGVSYTVSPTMVSLAPNTTAIVQVTLHATASMMRHTRPEVVLIPAQRHWLSEASGYLTLAPVNTPVVTYRVDLLGASESPPHTTGATGRATLHYTPATRELTYEIEVFNISGINGAHIHYGAPGVPGSVAYNLYDPTVPFDPDHPVTGTITISERDEGLLLSGDLYINVHTTEAPGGLIRGQIYGGMYQAVLRGTHEVPPVTSAASGYASFFYNPDTRELRYGVQVSSIVTVTAAHIHRAPAGRNGPVAYPLYGGEGGFRPRSPISGTVTLSEDDAARLLRGELYVNVHTSRNPSGEIRGQIISANPALRLGLYASARPASAMHAAPTSFDVGAMPTATLGITLTGQELNTGENYPQDQLSLVSVLALQGTSPNEPPMAVLTDTADLRAVGLMSDIAATASITDLHGVVSETILYFGLATHEDWSTPNAVVFEIYIDTNSDGTDDFMLSNINLGWAGGGGPTDEFVSILTDLQTEDQITQDFLNGFSAETIDTVLFNTNVMVLPVAAADLGLTNDQSRFTYRVESGTIDNTVRVDQTPALTYDVRQPGLLLDMEEAGPPLVEDLDGASILLHYDRAGHMQNQNQGVLLLHHHNLSGQRAEIISIQAGATIYLPLLIQTQTP